MTKENVINLIESVIEDNTKSLSDLLQAGEKLMSNWYEGRIEGLKIALEMIKEMK